MTYDLNRIAELLRNEKWTWAKTMPGIPHEYIVRDKCLMGEENFLMIVLAQRDLGTNEIWGKYHFPYLYVDGYKYWTMGDTLIDRKCFLSLTSLTFKRMMLYHLV